MLDLKPCPFRKQGLGPRRNEGSRDHEQRKSNDHEAALERATSGHILLAAKQRLGLAPTVSLNELHGLFTTVAASAAVVGGVDILNRVRHSGDDCMLVIAC